MTTDEARQAVDQEATLIDVIDAIARDAAEFDDIASAAEFGKPQDIGVADIRQQPGWPTLDEWFPGEEGTDTGLELAALVARSLNLEPSLHAAMRASAM